MRTSVQDLVYTVVDGIGQLTGDIAKRPVRRVRGPAEQRQCRHEAQIGQRQITVDSLGFDRSGFP